MRFTVRLTPRGGADRVDGVGEDGVLRARVAAPPVDGAANEALCRLLARELDVASKAVRVVQGQTARRKVLEADVEAARLAAAWPGIDAGSSAASMPAPGGPASRPAHAARGRA